MSAAGRISWALRRFCLQYGLPPADFQARLAALSGSQRWPAERLADHQRTLLRETLECAAARSPFYRDGLARLRMSPTEIATRDLLCELPVMQREDLARLYAAAVNAGIPKSVYVSSSSGTSGQPVHSLHGLDSLLSNQVCRARGLSRHGVDAWERQGLMVCQRMTTRHQIVAFLGDRVAGRRRNGGFEMRLAEARSTIRRFRRFRPAYLVGMPSLFNRMAWFARPAGADLREIGVRALLCNTELMMRPVERRIGAAFGATICNEYGCTEVGSIAHQCPLGTLHLNPEHAVVELLDTDNRPVRPGTPGRVVLTALQNRVLPLIRYDVGDWAVSAAAACACGLQPGLPGLERVEGRARSMWRNPAGTPVAPFQAVAAALEQLNWDEVTEAQLVQRRDHSIELRSLPATPPGSAVLSRMADTLTASLGFVVRVDSTGREVVRAPSGKQLPFFRESGD